MQPNTPSAGAGFVFAAPRIPPRAMPRWVVIGLVLAGTGYLMGRLPSLLILYLLRIGPILLYVQVQLALTSVGVLLLGVGLYLVFRDLRERLPMGRPWISMGALAVLAGAVCTAAIGLVDLALAPSMYGGAVLSSLPVYVFEAISEAVWVAETAIGAGVLLALFGTVRGLTSPAPSPVPPTFP